MWVSFAQDTSAISSYLLTAGSDKQLERFRAELTFLETTQIKSSWIRETEMRFASKGMNASVEDYRLRISPTNPWEVKTNKNYHKRLEERTQTRHTISYSQSLLSRYLLLIDHYFLKRLSELADEEIIFRKKFTEQMVRLQMEDFDLDDLIDFEAGLSKKEIDLGELQLELAEIEGLMLMDAEAGITWDGFDLISPTRISGVLNSLDSMNEMNLYKLEAQQKLLLEEQSHRVSKAEAFSNIGFLQANYEIDQGDTFQEHMGFQLGITLPLVNRDKADLARDEFELIEVKNEKELTDQFIDQQIHLLRKRMNVSLNLYATIDEKLERADALKPEVRSTTDLAAIIRHATYVSDLQERQAEVYQGLLEDFITFLEIKGQLVQQPLRNYLSESLPAMEE